MKLFDSVVICLLSLGVGSCQSSSGACATAKDCPPGHACDAGSCLKLCGGHEDCPRGEHCADSGVCRTGDSAVPIIESVSGISSFDCNVGDGTTAPCLGSAIVVGGRNLADATYELQPNGGGAAQTLLARSSSVRSVDLVPADPSALVPGAYALVVTNAAGADSAAVTLLRGEKGEPGEPGGSGGTLYVHTNGTLSSTTDIRHDRLVVRLARGTTDVASVALPWQQLTDLCADADGCTLELGVTGYSIITEDSTEDVLAPYMGRPCRFFMRDLGDGTWGWSVARHCYFYYAGGASGGYRPYSSGWHGIDGANVRGDSTEDNWPILDFEQLCVLAEAPPRSSPTSGNGVCNVVGSDTDAGLYLFAPHTNWWASCPDCTSCPNETPAAWSATGTCELIVQD